MKTTTIHAATQPAVYTADGYEQLPNTREAWQAELDAHTATLESLMQAREAAKRAQTARASYANCERVRQLTLAIREVSDSREYAARMILDDGALQRLQDALDTAHAAGRIAVERLEREQAAANAAIAGSAERAERLAGHENS